MSFHICCTYPLIYRMQLSTPSCPGNLTNHSPHTLEKKHRQGEETTESAIVLSGAHPKAAGSYREPPEDRQGDARSRRELSGAARELSGAHPEAVRLGPPATRELPGAVGSRQEVSGAARSCQEPAKSRQGAVRSQPGERSRAGGSLQEPTGSRSELSGAHQESRRELSGAVESRQEPPGSTANRALRAGAMIVTATVGPLWGSEILPGPTS